MLANNKGQNMGLFSGIVGGLLGGGKTKVTQTAKNETKNEITTNITNNIDMQSVADAVSAGNAKFEQFGAQVAEQGALYTAEKAETNKVLAWLGTVFQEAGAQQQRASMTDIAMRAHELQEEQTTKAQVLKVLYTAIGVGAGVFIFRKVVK